MQNKNFCINLLHTMFQRFFYSEHDLYSLLFIHMMKLKKMLVGAFLWIFAVTGVAVLPNYASAQATDDRWNVNGTNAINDQDQAGSKLLDTIKSTINWLLGILATIALVICLYAGFLMVTAAGDDKKYQQGITILKHAAIGLAIIWLSWLIVSVIFWFIGNASGWNNTINSWQNGGQPIQ